MNCYSFAHLDCTKNIFNMYCYGNYIFANLDCTKNVFDLFCYVFAKIDYISLKSKLNKFYGCVKFDFALGSRFDSLEFRITIPSVFLRWFFALF